MFLIQLGRLDIFECNYASGRPICVEGLAIARQLGDSWLVWGGLHALALAALAEHDQSTARALSHESLRLPAAPNMLLGMHIVHGLVALEATEYVSAREHLLEALTLAVSSEDPLATAQVVEYMAHLASCAGQSDVALQLAAAAEVARETLDVSASRLLECLPHLPLLRQLRERWLLPLRKIVGDEHAGLLWAEGRALSLSEAVALAQSWLLPAATVPSHVPHAPASTASQLTPRQQEVAVLVARGLTNRQIAERLVGSERAAAAHVENILNRLGFTSRIQIAVWASEHALLTERADEPTRN